MDKWLATFSRRLQKLANEADAQNITLGNGGEVGAMLAAIADELSIQAEEKSTWKECVWPYDPEAAKEIDCWVTPIYRGKLYVWRSVTDSSFNYTIACGANSDRSMTGATSTQDLEAAKSIALSRPEVRG